MPLNNVANRNHSIEIDGIISLLEATFGAVNSARTIEDRLLLEARVVELFKKILSGDLKLPSVNVNLGCSKENFAEGKSSLKYKTDINISKLEKLAQSYIDVYNTKVNGLLEVTGSMKRVRQKKAALDLWDREKAKWVVAEKFFNFDLLSTSDSGSQILAVDTVEGIATLPISNIEEVKPSSVFLAKGNGKTGNSNLEISTNNIDPSFMFDEDTTTHFEYERLDSGPLKLTLGCDFSKTQVLNRIQIKPATLQGASDFEIEDILFYLPGNRTISIKENIGPSVSYKDFVVKAIGNDIYWQMTFAPVKCNSVKIVLKQENSYTVENLTSDNRRASRKRYSIGITHIEFLKISFKSFGGISSNELPLPAGLYAAESTSEVFPKSSFLYNAVLDFSGNGGEDWALDVFGFENSKTPNTISLDGEESKGVWRIYAERNENAFEDVYSFSEEDPAVNVKVVSSFASQKSSSFLQLKEKPYNNIIGVYQPRVCRRTDDPREAVPLGRSPRVEEGEGFTLNLPIKLDESFYNLDPEDMSVYAGNKAVVAEEDSSGNSYSFEEIQEGLGSTDSLWAINEDWSRVAIQHKRQLSKITWCFPSQKLLLEERSNGFYAELDNYFDPDKDRIRISYLPSSLKSYTQSVLSAKKLIKLKHKNIFEGSVFFKTESKVLLTETSIFKDVKNDNTTDPSEILFYIDKTNGRIYLSKTIASVAGGDIGPIKVVYRHADYKVLSDESYEIWTDDNQVKGIVISPNSIVAQDIEFYPNTPSSSDFKKVDVRSGKTLTKEKMFAGSTKSIDLPDTYIVKNSLSLSYNSFEVEPEIYPKEVEHIDGKIEFLGIVNMDKETTVKIESDLSGIISFNLAAGSQYYEPLGVVFDDTTVFVVLDETLSTVGSYTVSSEGEVSIRVANLGESGTLPEGIAIIYSYKDPNFVSRGLYSVDYELGVLYCASELLTETKPKLTYKVVNYKAEYDIVKPINSWSYTPSSNSIEVRSEKLNSEARANKRVKAYFFTRGDYEPLKDLRMYFSPIFYNISFRFQ
jgi:hypothetical protein